MRGSAVGAVPSNASARPPCEHPPFLWVSLFPYHVVYVVFTAVIIHLFRMGKFAYLAAYFLVYS